METLWPWLAVAGLGALHGMSPANGWMFAAACGIRARDDAQARRALLPIAIGHVASIAIVVCAVAQGILMNRAQVQGAAGVLLLGLAAYRWLRGAGRHATSHRIAGIRATRVGQAGIALWSCLMATAHGAGLMLAPALVPLCMSNLPMRELTASGSVIVALMAVGIHMAAMLATTGAIASGVCRGVAMHPRLLSGATLRHAWTIALAVAGALLIALGQGGWPGPAS